ncbi:helix-turn-helix transcriptional regulator [Flavobacterium sp. LC2016-12]|uniref:AraC family transcriptional regulator n=1 Tax=Flavobacterium sp. LC2016-12 TaxID=2783794 RepID=UPI00188A9A51|nr:helix-turn-helix transcriptional regulator [Flavobacterium sp. LC2016-12]MBF4465815.1 AraC family transcriptional regulator [Flavobacterium sp. LC2016-12]
MPKKPKNIPIIAKSESGEGIFISTMLVEDTDQFEDVKHSHRDDYHLFSLQLKGTTSFEIDFQKYTIESPSIFYIHPNQVHRVVSFENVSFSSLAITNASLSQENLKLLEEITPVKPLLLSPEKLSMVSEVVTLCLRFSERKEEKLYHSLLKDSCNVLVSLIASYYLEETHSADKFSRFETITKSFKVLLEHNFVAVKKPTEYAQLLNISTPYLNECIKNTTGYSVTHHIQQRIILEAKRLLYHSDNSVKEIAGELGYDDYPYFSRLFTKVAGISPLAFRNKNFE